MNINLGACAQPEELLLSVADATIATACYRLAATEQIAFDLLVDRNLQDDITLAIKNQTYGYPAGFQLFTALVQPGRRVLDLGAHIGTFSLFAAALGCQVVSVEAAPHNAALLEASSKRNGFEQVHVVQRAISNRAETLEFVQAGPYGLVANPFVSAPTIRVDALTVDQVLADVGWEQVDFIKLDIEGSEVKAVEGMSRLLASDNAPPILYESNGHTLHLFGQTPNTLMAALEAFGYHCYLVEWGKLIPTRAHDFQATCTVDYLAIKRLPAALQGWQLAPPLSHAERRARAILTAQDDHPLIRAYIGRALAGADKALLADPQIRAAIKALQNDADEAVRKTVTWWDEAKYPAASHAARLWQRLQTHIKRIMTMRE